MITAEDQETLDAWLDSERRHALEDHETLAEDGYCVLCDGYGHTVRSCPTRDDDVR